MEKKYNNNMCIYGESVNNIFQFKPNEYIFYNID